MPSSFLKSARNHFEQGKKRKRTSTFYILTILVTALEIQHTNSYCRNIWCSRSRTTG
uniref:Uncharacterized protein n=1 Tax=Rhizophora mucronata TaxID=61149 RepID=A0A2P2QN55_RHIMU